MGFLFTVTCVAIVVRSAMSCTEVQIMAPTGDLVIANSVEVLWHYLCTTDDINSYNFLQLYMRVAEYAYTETIHTDHPRLEAYINEYA